MPSERARLPRVDAVFRVRYTTLDQLVVAYSSDLSKGGMFLATENILPVGAVVGLDIELPHGGGERNIQCRVVYTRDPACAERTAKSVGMGIQFLNLDEEALSQFGRFIAEQSVLDATSTPGRRYTLKVLVVDDDHASREAAARPFRDRGDTVLTASNGLEALATCLSDPPEVILSDVQMPRMDGWQLARIVRSRKELSRVPFVFLTRLKGEEERLKAYQLGVDDFVPKPFRSEELVARIDRLVSRASGALGAAPGSGTALAEPRGEGKIVEEPPGSGTVLVAAKAPSQKNLRGDLEQVSLASVLSFLELERKTGVLCVTFAARIAKVHLDQGRPVQAELQGAEETTTARERLSSLLDWKAGEFEFESGKVDCHDEVRASLTSLLLAHACENDEEARSVR